MPTAATPSFRAASTMVSVANRNAGIPSPLPPSTRGAPPSAFVRRGSAPGWKRLAAARSAYQSSRKMPCEYTPHRSASTRCSAISEAIAGWHPRAVMMRVPKVSRLSTATRGSDSRMSMVSFQSNLGLFSLHQFMARYVAANRVSARRLLPWRRLGYANFSELVGTAALK